ncbi:MAG: hypothetical protein AAF485_03810, partial [Chloroflexota bacterium]
MFIKIWGARGSIPTPIRSDAIREKLATSLLNIASVEPGEFREKLTAALLDDHQLIDEASDKNLDEEYQLEREQLVHRYLDGLPPLVTGTAGGNTPCIEIRVGNDLFIV